MSNKFHFTKKDQVFNKELINQVLGRFDQIHKENAYKSITSNIKELTKNDVLNEPLMHSLLDKIYEQFEFITGKSDLIFLKVWLVTSKSNHTNKEILPYIPHIDRNRKLKAMVYLHDIDLEHGPIHLGKLKHTIDIDHKRKKLPEDFQIKGLNTIDDEHLESDLTPMTGKAGDTVFFDTNTPHKAGIVKDNYCRKILRFDFERPYFNPKPSILNRLINKFK
ncbi:phytanoyl-CoA dioxygenase family protein [Candidatus Pelagibacter sp.]|nr:phytanoyl-CoA dioxygenase family protein [Candidatus Pelagibacter sp.]